MKFLRGATELGKSAWGKLCFVHDFRGKKKVANLGRDSSAFFEKACPQLPFSNPSFLLNGLIWKKQETDQFD